MNTTYITVGAAFLFLVLLWIAVGIRHLRLLRRNVEGSWEFVDEKIRKRHDVIPLLIEIVRKGTGDGSGAGAATGDGSGTGAATGDGSGTGAATGDGSGTGAATGSGSGTGAATGAGAGGLSEAVRRTVAVRDDARRIYFASGDKTEKEYDLSKALGQLIETGHGNEAVARDTNFLELKKELDELGRDIENRAGEYNNVVRKFNKNRKIFLLMPLALVMRLKQALIFEFEK